MTAVVPSLEDDGPVACAKDAAGRTVSSAVSTIATRYGISMPTFRAAPAFRGTLYHRRVRELFEQRRAVRLPAQLARRLAAVDLQVACQRVGVRAHLRARVFERDVR